MNLDIQKHVVSRMRLMYGEQTYDATTKGYKRRVQTRNRLARKLGFNHYVCNHEARSYIVAFWRGL